MHLTNRIRTTLRLLTPAIAILASTARADGGDAAAGKSVYAANCVVCHGEKGKGDGPGAASLNPKPKDFTDAKAMSKITDATRVKAVTEGGQAAGVSQMMPPFGQVLSPKQIQDVLAYVAQFSSKK